MNGGPYLSAAWRGCAPAVPLWLPGWGSGSDLEGEGASTVPVCFCFCQPDASLLPLTSACVLAAVSQEVVIIGGVDMQQQARDLARRPHVVVATPGRLRVRALAAPGFLSL